MFGIPLYPKIKLSENEACSKRIRWESLDCSKKSLGNSATLVVPNDASIFAKIVSNRVEVNDAEISTTPRCEICAVVNPCNASFSSQNSNNEVAVVPVYTSYVSPIQTPITTSVRERNAIATLHAGN